jgi:hypothetical protein
VAKQDLYTAIQENNFNDTSKGKFIGRLAGITGLHEFSFILSGGITGIAGMDDFTLEIPGVPRARPAKYLTI